MTWFLAITRSRQEHRVAGAFKALKIRHYLFRYRRKVVRRGQNVEEITPVFPRYVFANITKDWMWRKILETSHVIKIATGIDDQPWVCSPILIKRMLARLGPDGLLPFIPPSRFQFGDKVWVSGITSIVSGHTATYQFPTHPGRSCVLMDWLGRQVPVEIDDRDLEKYESRYNRRRRRGRRGRRSFSRREGLAATYQPRNQNANATAAVQ